MTEQSEKLTNKLISNWQEESVENEGLACQAAIIAGRNSPDVSNAIFIKAAGGEVRL